MKSPTVHVTWWDSYPREGAPAMQAAFTWLVSQPCSSPGSTLPLLNSKRPILALLWLFGFMHFFQCQLKLGKHFKLKFHIQSI